MYDILRDIVSHVWISNSTSDQQYYVYGAIALAIIVFCLVYDLITRIFASILRRNK